MLPPKPTKIKAVPPAALVVWPWLTTRLAGSPASSNTCEPLPGDRTNGPLPSLWRNATMVETRPMVTAASTARRKSASPMGRRREFWKPMLGGWCCLVVVDGAGHTMGWLFESRPSPCHSTTGVSRLGSLITVATVRTQGMVKNGTTGGIRDTCMLSDIRTNKEAASP